MAKDILIIPSSGSIEFTSSIGNYSKLSVESDASLTFDNSVKFINITGSIVSASSGIFTSVDIDGGTINDLTALTIANDVDIGN